MGMRRKHSGGGYDYSSSPPAYVPPNPDPTKFRVEKVVACDDLYASLVHYEGCTNFEGKKVLVTNFNPKFSDTLDPHFEPGSGIIARFEPTDRGWQMAIRLIEREG